MFWFTYQFFWFSRPFLLHEPFFWFSRPFWLSNVSAAILLVREPFLGVQPPFFWFSNVSAAMFWFTNHFFVQPPFFGSAMCQPVGPCVGIRQKSPKDGRHIHFFGRICSGHLAKRMGRKAAFMAKTSFPPHLCRALRSQCLAGMVNMGMGWGGVWGNGRDKAHYAAPP